jgi:arylsulfatase A-like enzyme
MKGIRGASATGGFLAGAMLGAVLGMLDALSILKFCTVSGSLWRAFFIIVLAVTAYSVSGALAGTLLGMVFTGVRRAGPRVSSLSREEVVARSFARTLGLFSGVALFILADWRMRVAPTDLSVLRLYCLPWTLGGAALAGILGMIIFLAARRLALRQVASRWLASPLIRRWTTMKLTALSAVLVATLLFEPAPPARHGEVDGQRANVVLISIDTLRAGHLGYMGYDRPTSPFIDQLADRSVVFSRAVCQFPLTSPSMASVLTSRYVRSHGSVDNAIPIHDSARLLPEVLQAHGYNTAAFVTNRICGIDYGFARGFDYYVGAGNGDLSRSRASDWLTQLRMVRIWWRLTGRERMTVSAVRWLDDRDNGPFFLWYHQLAPHSPYAPPFAYERDWDRDRSRIIPTTKVLERINNRQVQISDADLAHVVDLYDAEIRFTDDLLRQIFDALRRNGLIENTLVIFVADHGESLFDRSGYIGHGEFLYDEEVMVPLFFYSPGYIPAPGMVGEPVETMNIAPTVLEFLGLQPEPSFQGRSLWSTIATAGGVERVSTPDSVGTHSWSPKPAFAINGSAKMVRVGGWKYIAHAGYAELFDLTNDPGELRNVNGSETGRAQEMGDLLREWDVSVPEVRPIGSEPDKRSLKLLSSLGYIN